MKKQILILTFFVAALLAGTNAFGQKSYQNVFTAPSTSCLTPFPLANCTADELHPVQGEVYTYTVDATTQTDIRWFVVNNYTVETTNGDSLVGFNGVLPSSYTDIDPADGTGDYIYGLGTTYTGYNVDPVQDATGANHSIEIAWKYFDGTLPNEVLLVAYAEDSVGCTNNIAVYRIIPTPAFTIDIAVLNDAGDSIAGPTDPLTGECVSVIESALYTATDNITPNTTGDVLTVDYGENWVFYKVNGANYIDSWMPEFQISYDGTAPGAVEASWAYLSDANNSDPAVWHTLTGSLGGTWTSADVVVPGATAATEGTSGYSAGESLVPAAGGECIVVRVRLDWGTGVEHDQANSTLTFAANGVAYDGDNTSGTYYDDRTYFEDLKNNGTVGTDCQPDGFDNDVVDYEITKRPRVEEGTPTQEDKTGQGVN